MTRPRQPRTAADASSGGAKRPTASPTPPPHPNPPATEVAARLPHRDTAIWGVRHQDHAVDRDLRVPDERAQRLEVLRRPVDVRVARDEHVGRCLSHYDLPSGPAREDLNEAQGFCRELTS